MKDQLRELGARKAVEELHPELHAEFRAAWAAGMSKAEASEWAYRLGRLPDAESSTYTLGLREARAKGWDDDLAGRHPRQAEVLAEIPKEDRAVVASSARLMQNMTGGILSGCLYSAAAEYRRIGAEELAKRDRLTNARAMGWRVDEDGHRIKEGV
jgi:hypothetical protein